MSTDEGEKHEGPLQKLGKKIDELGHKMKEGMTAKKEKKREEKAEVPHGSLGTMEQKRSMDEHSLMSLAFAEREFARRRLHHDIEKGRFKLKHTEITHDASKPFLGPEVFEGEMMKLEKKESKKKLEKTEKKKTTEELTGVHPDMQVLQAHEKMAAEIVHPPVKLRHSKIEHDASNPYLEGTLTEVPSKRVDVRKPERFFGERNLEEQNEAEQREAKEVPLVWKGELAATQEQQKEKASRYRRRSRKSQELKEWPERQIEGEQGRKSPRDKGEVDDLEVLVAHLKVAREINDEKVKLKHTKITHDASIPAIPKDFKLQRQPLQKAEFSK